MRTGISVFRAVMAVLIVAAVVGQLMTSVAFWKSEGVTDFPFFFTNYFSYFTIESNLLAAVVFSIGAVFLIRRTGADPHWFLMLRVSVFAYMVTTGIVYNLLLRSIPSPPGSSLEWSNEVMHTVVPIVVLVDWILVPGRAALAKRSILPVIVFPIVWVIYTLVRGPLAINQLTGRPWYPYPFLNPDLAGNSYGTVALYVLMIAIVISGLAAVGVWISRWRLVLRDSTGSAQVEALETAA